MTRIAVYQARSGIDPAANSAALVAAVQEAAAGGAAMLFTPEMSGLLDSDRQRAAAAVQSEEADQALRDVRQAARDSRIWVQLGSLALQGPGDRFVNRAFVIDDDGEIRARYDKIHLFDVDLPTGESWRESAVYAGGQRPVLVRETPVGALGLTICYDCPLPRLVRAACRGRGGGHLGACRLHRADGQGPLGNPAAGEGDRGRAVRGRGGPGRPS